MLVKITTVLVLIGMLCSYAPAFPEDGCSESGHTGSMGSAKISCGYIFHCPIVFNAGCSEPLPLPFLGQLILTPHLLMLKETTSGIFHPPKCGLAALTETGDKEGYDQEGVGARIAFKTSLVYIGGKLLSFSQCELI